MLRRLYLWDGLALLVVGFLLWGFSNSEWGLALFGIDSPGGYGHLSEWRAISFGGPLGGALMAFGFAALAVAHSRDTEFHRTATVYFLAGHFFLGFNVFAKQMAFWGTEAGFILLDVVAFPGAAFLYFLISGFTDSPQGRGTATEREQRIREAAGQEERYRLAQDLHDSVKQQIYSIQTNLATAETRWDSDAIGARDAITRARTSARDALSEMIALLDRLRHDPIESVGLVEALRRQCEALGHQTGAEVTTRFGNLPDATRLPAGTMKSVFRIAQEALANVGRHSRAQHVNVVLAENETGSQFVLSITDDGQGFDAESPSTGIGLRSIHARSSEIGADIRIESSAGSGCCVELRMGLRDPRAEESGRYWVRLVATVIPLVPTLALALVSVDFRPYAWPFIALGGLLVIFHGSMLARLKWQRAKSST